MHKDTKFLSTSILGVRVDIVSKNRALGEILHLARLNRPSYVVTVNPEQIYDAYYDPAFKRILNESDLSLCDGTGVLLASYLFPPRVKERVRGSEILPEILRMTANLKMNIKVVLQKGSLSTKVAIEKYLSLIGIPKDRFKVTDEVDDASTANITLFAMSHYKANQYIANCVSKNHLGLKINIGGSFDYLLGLQRTPFPFLRCLGLEWLYRWMTRPCYRAKRVFKAVILFPLLLLSTKISLTLFGTKE